MFILRKMENHPHSPIIIIIIIVIKRVRQYKAGRK